jgi:cyclophilin family peptidyl-prolyl cis-trans isomerase
MLQRKNVILFFLATALALSLFSCKSEQARTGDVMIESTTPEEPLSLGGKEVAVIQTNLGTIIFEFFEKDAPNHVANFKKLTGEGYYNGICFHRVIPGFMIQAGDPNTKDDDRSNDGLGGPGYTIDAEFNNRSHKRGTLSMARKPDPNSAGSQFFICHKAQPGLDGQYTVFGQVVKGMDVVDKIANAERDARDNPIEKIVMEKVTIEAR